MSGESVLTVVIVIALVALVGRLALSGDRLDSRKMRRIVVAGVAAIAFAVGFLVTDPYRAETMMMGSVGQDGLTSGYVVGREAEADVVKVDSVGMDKTPRFFTVDVVSVEETGYYRLKTSVESEVMRTVEVNREDESKIAIERKTQLFEVTNKPSKESDYAAIYKMTLKSGQSVLGVLPEYDAKAGQSKVVMLTSAEGKMASVAEKSGVDEKECYIDGYDRARHTAHSEKYLVYRGIGGLAVAIVAVVVGLIIIKRKK